MCKPNGEAGNPAKCQRRGDCRGCPHFAFDDGEREDRRTAPGPQIWAVGHSADLVAKSPKWVLLNEARSAARSREGKVR